MKKNLYKRKFSEGKEVNMMIRNMIRASVLVVVIVLLAVANSANALTIAEINDPNGQYNGNIIFGDKLFSDFDVSANLAPEDVLVSGYQVGNTVYIRFSGPFVTTNYTSGVDYGLYYAVESLGGLIYAIDQRFNLTSLAPGGIVAIGETVYDAPGGNNVAQSSVGFYLSGDYNDPPAEPSTGDSLYINPALDKVWVSKDIFLIAYQGGLVGATWFEQSFSQVPEPGVLVLLGSGLLGLAFYGRLRKK